MLQYIAQTNEKYSIAEQAQMVIEGGCKWIVLRVPDIEDSEIREIAAELVPLCKETSTILTLENRIELARELGLHGVLVSPGCLYSPSEVRQMCGPEAIVGVVVTEASAAMPLPEIDIDYVVFPPTVSLQRIGENVEALRHAHFVLPIVAEGCFPIMSIPDVLKQGVNGIATGCAIINETDPVQATADYIEALKHDCQ